MEVIDLIILIAGIIILMLLVTEFENSSHNNISEDKDISGLIKVNGELIDEDDYYQMDWKSYTPAKDSIE